MSNFTIADIPKIPDIPQSFAPPAGMMGVFGENPWDVAARDADEAEAKRGMEISLLLNDSAYLGQRRVRDQTGKQTGANLRFIPEGITAAMLETGEMPAALIPAEFAGDGKRYADMLLDEGISEIAEVEVLKLRKGEGKGKLGITRELVSRNLAALAKLQPGVAGSWKAFFAAVRTHWGLATQRAVVMRMAERKGEYDPTEREAYLNKLLGLDAQVEHDAGVKDEFSRMMAGFDDVEADDIPFSIGRSPLRLAGTMDEATLAAAEIIGKPISNLDDGLTATLSKNTLGKMVSQSAARKSISPQAHAFSVANLDRLFKNAIRTHSGVDRDNDPNILAMHRYFSPILHMGEVLLAKLTVKEFARESEGSRIYSVEAMDVVKPAGNWVASISEERRNYTPQAGFEEKLQQRIDEVKPSGDASFSLGPAQVAGILSDDALGRITDPRRRTYVMAKISKDFNAMRLQIDRIASLAGVRRSKGDMRREANAREDLAAEEKIAAIHQRFGDFPTRVGMAR